MEKPNILWICTDQQRFDSLGCYGNRLVDTPNVDRLASEGVRFDLAFCQNPMCTPSRGSFLTGRYPRTCGCRQNGVQIPDTEILVTRRLADAGYRCGLAGKLHLSTSNPDVVGAGKTERRINDGYTDFHWSHHSRSMGQAVNEYHDWLAERGLEWSAEPYEGSAVVSTAMSRDTSQCAWCAEKAVDFINARAADGLPWLFSVNIYDPHHAFDPPMEYLEPYLDRIDEVPLPAYVEGELENKPSWQAYDHENGAYGGWVTEFAWPRMSERDHRLTRAAYWAMCDQIDYHVGRMLAALEATGQRENTIVIFMSDHGELLGDHGVYYKGAYFYDCSVRVPLIISAPGRITPGDSAALVELLDVPQTILDAVGLDHHDGMQGLSLWPLLTGSASPDKHREDIYSEFYTSWTQPDDITSLPKNATMVRTRSHKLVLAHGHRMGELYDLEADPGEHRNCWNDHEYGEAKNELLVRLADRMAGTVDPLPLRQAPW